MRMLAVLAPLLLAAPAPHDGAHADVHADATRAARALVRAFEEDRVKERPVLLLELDDPRRRALDFFPLAWSREARGLRLGAMTLDERRATHELLRGLLSEEGYLRVQAIRSLETRLRVVEGDTRGVRDPDLYVVRLYGRPSTEAPWGVQVEGHHLSLNATLADGEVRATPLFLGANPAEVRGGPDAGLRVLGTQRELARALLDALDEAQRAKAVVGERAVPALAPGALPAPTEPTGLAAAEMDEAQRALLVQLVASYAGHLRAALAADELRRMEAAGVERLRFLWIGGTAPGAPHTYVVAGPTVLIQMDAIENARGDGANHLHALWRDPERDFGADLLARHYAEEHAEDR